MCVYLRLHQVAGVVPPEQTNSLTFFLAWLEGCYCPAARPGPKIKQQMADEGFSL